MADVRAKETLYVDGARAHNVGDSVPPENVEPNGWEDKVTGYTAAAKTQAKQNMKPRSDEQAAAEEAAANPPEPEK